MVFDLLFKVADISFLSAYKSKIMVSSHLKTSEHIILDQEEASLKLIEKAETQPNLTMGVLISVVVVFLSLFFKLIFGGTKAYEMRNSGAVIHSYGMESCLVTMLNPQAK